MGLMPAPAPAPADEPRDDYLDVKHVPRTPGETLTELHRVTTAADLREREGGPPTLEMNYRPGVGMLLCVTGGKLYALALAAKEARRAAWVRSREERRAEARKSEHHVKLGRLKE